MSVVCPSSGLATLELSRITIYSLKNMSRTKNTSGTVTAGRQERSSRLASRRRSHGFWRLARQKRHPRGEVAEVVPCAGHLEAGRREPTCHLLLAIPGKPDLRSQPPVI